MDSTIGFAILMLVLGGIVLAVAYANYQDEQRLRASGERVRGLVTRNKFHFGRNSYFRPIVRFTTRAGEVVEAEYEKGAAFAIPRYSAGTAVWVAYDKHNPRDFLLLTPGNIM